MNRIRIEGDWERWIAFFADGVCEMAENAVGAARELFGVAGEDRGRIQTLGRVSGSSMQVHHALQRRPVGTISRLAKETGLSLPTVTKALLALEGAGLVKEISGRRRNRVFVYSRYLDILVKGTGWRSQQNGVIEVNLNSLGLWAMRSKKSKYSRLISNIQPIARELMHIKRQAEALGMFTNDRRNV